MTSEERKQQIMEQIQQAGSVRVTDLSTQFRVSEVTIRNDLQDLESKGLLTRVHGGAIHSYKPYFSMNLSQRLETNHSEKVQIAERIASMIRPNDTVMLNSGTTTLLAFRKFPAEYNLNIVTNSVSIALEASSNLNYNVVLIGGSVNTKYQFTYGIDATEQIRKYRADKLILSVDGIDTENGFSTYYDKEAAIDQAMIERAHTCIVAADKTKFMRTAFVRIAPLTVADRIVTTEKTDTSMLEELAAVGIEIVL